MLGLGDQAVYSIANFALTIFVARSATPSAFGAFAIAVIVYGLGLALVRGLTSETFVVRFSSVAPSERGEFNAAARAATGAALVVGLVVGVGMAVAGVALWSTAIGRVFVAFGVLVPGLVVQDCLRFVALAAKQAGVALASDLVTALAQFAAFAVLLGIHEAKPWTLVAAWGLAAHVGIVVALAGLGARTAAPRPTHARRWLVGERELAVRYAADDLAIQGSQQVSSLVVAAVAGLAQTGGLRAVQTVFGPPSIVYLGVTTALTPELVRLARRPGRMMARASWGIGLGLGVVGALWGLAAIVIPDHWGRALFGPTWLLAHPLLPWFAITQAANGIRVGPTAGLRALAQAKRTLRARTTSTILVLLTSVTGAVVDGAHGVAVALAVTTPVMTLIWAYHFNRAMGERRPVPEQQHDPRPTPS